ncbi:hypothetical protein [Variovorax guangxiensis]|uniref:Uncharacterized protein n=1 Tax=Variovorax guangxiensis TaxID=1775474 RepID=A0A502DE69_9BURK|nr:hypothetical protein [Variovorax guangxiensis]TPG23453.1 hypothetical protein EAH82_20530 [Variovorax guangxiensis]TPG24088.1 hypothetical protein EAH83_06190 [Variovorax ginsengisoli]
MPDVALEVRDDIVDKQACPKLSVNLNEHLRNVAFDKLVQQDNPRPVLHEEAALINEICPFKTLGSCRRKVSPHEFVDATCVHLAWVRLKIGGACERRLLAESGRCRMPYRHDESPLGLLLTSPPSPPAIFLLNAVTLSTVPATDEA